METPLEKEHTRCGGGAGGNQEARRHGAEESVTVQAQPQREPV
jgi:hypothetical protein